MWKHTSYSNNGVTLIRGNWHDNKCGFIGEQVMLPIWHGITKKEILDYSPSLADKVARNTASYTVEEIAEEIAELINGED